MKIAVVTMHVKLGKCEENYQYMVKKIEQAIQDNAQLIIFPQNAISGYLLGDTWLDHDWCSYVDGFNELITAYSDQIAIVWGNIKYRGGRLFNCAFYAYQSHTHMRVHKNVNDFLYHDNRYFVQQDMNSAIEYDQEVFALNFHKELQLADLNLNIDAHPYFHEEEVELKGTYVYSNSVGIAAIGKNVVLYPGGSRVVINKKLIYEAPYFQESYAIVDTSVQNEVTLQKPSLLDALTYGIKQFDKETLGGNCPWIIGLSGGLDSSVNAALLTYALGKKRVIAYQMNTSYNCSITKANALQEAKALGITLKSGSIEKLTNATIEVMEEYGYSQNQWNSLVDENIQARIRGHMLGTFAQINGGVVANNGNKVEVALGYCTLYGDAVGALGILGDVTKTQLFELSHELNLRFKKEVIPASLLPQVNEQEITWEMPPSAELKDNQLDPMKWFYHDYLVEHLGKDITITSFMKAYLDKSIWQGELAKWLVYYGLEEPAIFIKDLDWFTNTMQKNGFKRIQTPPILTISKNAFGSSRMEIQGNIDKTMYDLLKSQILNMKV